jgi:hypothetical protein
MIDLALIDIVSQSSHIYFPGGISILSFVVRYCVTPLTKCSMDIVQLD